MSRKIKRTPTSALSIKVAFEEFVVAAVVSQGGKVIGEALMVIPQGGQTENVNGVKHTKYLLIGACSGKAEKNENCEIAIQPRDLWAIER